MLDARRSIVICLNVVEVKILPVAVAVAVARTLDRLTPIRVSLCLCIKMEIQPLIVLKQLAVVDTLGPGHAARTRH